MFGDILMWVLTFFGLVPWETLFGHKKDFQEQLAEFEDGDGPVTHTVSLDRGMLRRVDSEFGDGSHGGGQQGRRRGTLAPDIYDPDFSVYDYNLDGRPVLGTCGIGPG